MAERYERKTQDAWSHHVNHTAIVLCAVQAVGHE